MKSTSKSFLTLFIVAGFAISSVDYACAAPAPAKKKVVVGTPAAKPAERIVKVSYSPKARQSSRAVAIATQHGVMDHDDGVVPKLASSAVAVIDQTTGDVIYEKNANAVVPIASITKLMTAMVALDAQPSLAETLIISDADVDTLKGTHSRLSVGTQLTREEMLRLALMSSENRASSALSRHYPGGREAFIAAMNQKARDLGLADTRFLDPTGLTAHNVSSARDLVKMVDAAHQYPLIREFSTSEEHQVDIKGRAQTFRNTNALVKSDNWSIGLSKTGYISEAGKCLVMQAWLNNKPTIIVLLDSWGKVTRIADAQRIKRWMERIASSPVAFRS
jgi:D-alanyl-D-alanine endopeptidase (penicillin-binding protein 7)